VTWITRHTFIYSLLLAGLALSSANRPAAAQSTLGADSLGGIPPIPPLDQVLAVGLRHSPRVRSWEALERKTRHELERERKEWLDGISVGATTTYGSWGNDILNQTQTGTVVGLTVRWSLFDLFGRGDAVGVLREELVATEAKTFEVMEDERADLISLYTDLRLAERLVAVNGEAAQTTAAHREMANAEFTQGDIPVSELARVTEISTKAKALFETAVSEYMKRYKLLENRIGVSLESLLYDDEPVTLHTPDSR
jgi:outer membrane protein TolC